MQRLPGNLINPPPRSSALSLLNHGVSPWTEFERTLSSTILFSLTVVRFKAIYSHQVYISVVVDHTIWFECSFRIWTKNDETKCVSILVNIDYSAILFMFVCLFVWWCLSPFSTTSQLYRGGQLYWWRKPEDPEKTTNLSQSILFSFQTYLDYFAIANVIAPCNSSYLLFQRDQGRWYTCMHARVGFERSCSLSHKKASIRSNGKELSLLSENINGAIYYTMYVYISFTELGNKSPDVGLVQRHHYHLPCAGRSLIFFLLLVFNATFINISTISWQPVLVMEEAGENHRPWASNW
jgi:hypothetical protein